MILMGSVGFLILMIVISNLRPKQVSENQLPSSIPEASSHQLLPAATPGVEVVKTDDEDDAIQKEMKDQMDKDRNQQRQIKMLKMQLEQVNLQLDNEKALTEINKLKKENAGYVKDENTQNNSEYPNIRVIYIGGTETERQAVVSIDGTSYSVKSMDKPVSYLEILNITNKGVKVRFDAPHVLTTFINYVQD